MLSLIHALYSSLEHALCLLSLLSSSVIAWLWLPMADIPLALGSRTVPLSQLPASNSNSSQWLNCSITLIDSLTKQLLFTSLTDWLTDCSSQLVPLITTWTTQKTPFLIVVVQLLPWEQICLRSCYSVTAVVYLLISQSLPNNGSTCYTIKGFNIR
jgi:hypothetical protein